MADEQKKNTSEIYQIRIQGHLDTKWSEWFYGMTITHESDGTTTLCGSLPDQTVLHSVLDRIRDMNLQLISVKKIAELDKSQFELIELKKVARAYGNSNKEKRTMITSYL